MAIEVSALLLSSGAITCVGCTCDSSGTGLLRHDTQHGEPRTTRPPLTDGSSGG